jgi:hypothetical protein
MWHVALPTGDVVHPMVLRSTGHPHTTFSRDAAAGSDHSIRFARDWLRVTRTFIRRVCRYDAERICPLCSEDAHQYGIPNLSDYP